MEDANIQPTPDQPRRVPRSDDAKLAVTVSEAASLLSVGTTTVKKLIGEGKLRSVLIFGARRIPYAALMEFAGKGTE